MRYKGRKGFALIELMVVVAVVSMAASFFVPRFLKHRIQKKREECRKNLEALFAAEKVHFDRSGRFTEDLSALDWTPQGTNYRYQFLPPENPRGFLFECTGNIDKDPALDTARIDETGRFVQIVDDTRR